MKAFYLYVKIARDAVAEGNYWLAYEALKRAQARLQKLRSKKVVLRVIRGGKP